MIKLSTLKCSLLATLVLTFLDLCFQIAIVIYQSIVEYSGINQQILTVSSCPGTYLNLKLTAFSVYKILSFFMICIVMFLTIIMFILILLAFIKFKELIISNTQQLEKQERPVFFNQKGLTAAYILYSIMILFNIIHFGVMLSYTIEYFICKTKLLTESLVLSILSLVCLIMFTVCWTITLVACWRNNQTVQENQEIRQKQRLYTLIQLTEMNIKENEQSVKNAKQISEEVREQIKNEQKMYQMQRQWPSNETNENPHEYKKKQKAQTTPKFQSGNLNILSKNSYLKYMEKQSPSKMKERQHSYFRSSRRRKVESVDKQEEGLVWTNNEYESNQVEDFPYEQKRREGDIISKIRNKYNY